MQPWLKQLFNLILGLAVACGLSAFFVTQFAMPYLHRSLPVGGDYFTFLTFTTWFHTHHPFPATGWLPFWNGGQPLIGGYPWLTFYLIQPLTRFTDPATAMDIFSLVTFIIFLLASLLLFFYLSRNWFFATTCSLILLLTKASYYQLAAAGLISASSAQMYLPLSLIFTLAYLHSAKPKLLIMAGLISGLGLLHHSPTVLLTTVIPQLLIILLFAPTKLAALFFYLLPTLTIGSPALYSTFIQNFYGSGSDNCSDNQCWGIYPKHLQVWLTGLSPLLTLILLPATLIKKPSLVKPCLAVLAVPVFYALVAHLHLINGLANVIFPIRLFWAANLALLALACALFAKLHLQFPRLSLVAALVSLLVCGFFAYYPPFTPPFDRTNSVPVDAAVYVVPKYHTQPLSKLVPDWLDTHIQNFRLDSFQSGLVAWWTLVSEWPAVRGYANHPVGVQRDWQYFLTTTTRTPQTQDSLLLTNQLLFLLDHFGIGVVEDTVSTYPKSFTSNPRFVTTTTPLRESIWHQINPAITSPIVYPTNGTPILFIGSATNYQQFVRALTLTGLTSKTLIPVQGPPSFDVLSSHQLTLFSHLFISNSPITKHTEFDNFIHSGGTAFIDTVTPQATLPASFPVARLQPAEVTGIWTPNFAPLTYNSGPWKVLAQSQLKPQTTDLAPSSSQPILLSRLAFGSGQVVLSTLNIPYHLTTFHNSNEVALFSQVLMSQLPQPTPSTFSVTRPQPNQIIISGTYTGIYFKENFHPGWTAYTGTTHLPVYRAGLGFMYIPTSAAPITLRFTGSAATWLFFILPIVGFLGTLLALTIPNHHYVHFSKRFTHPLLHWFDSE